MPVYPQGVAYLAADDDDEPAGRISLGPPPVTPDCLLARASGSGLRAIVAGQRPPPPRGFRSSSLARACFISVTLDDPADESAKDAVVTVVERAAALAPPQESGFPIDVTFPGESEPDYIDQWFAAFTTPFYRR